MGARDGRSPAAGVTQKANYRLLANSIAHQWWGVSVSPASRDDWWLDDGCARYSEARYVESAAGAGGFEEMVKDMSVGALSYDTVPMSQAGKLDMYSPEFQSLATDKGAMILHMLRWVDGDQKYDQTMRQFASQYAGKSVTSDDFKSLAEKNYGDKLTWFFSQWLRFNRRARIQDQVHGLSSGQQQGLPQRRANHSRSRSVPHAGGIENRHRR